MIGRGEGYRYPTQPARRIRIEHNLFYDITYAWGHDSTCITFGEPAITDITVAHNTGVSTGMGLRAEEGTTTVTGLYVTNNIFNQHIIYGGWVGTEALTIYAGDTWQAQRNVLVGRVRMNEYPSDNFNNSSPLTFDDVGFVNRANDNYRLASTSLYKNAGTDGKDVGADIDYLEGVISGQIQPPPPVWAPTVTFNASSLYFMPGTSLTLSWMTENATGVSINQGIGAVPTSGSLTVTPTQTTTCVLTAQGIGGTTTKSVRVNILPTGNTYQASRDFSDTQGLRNWSYLYDGSNPMTFDIYTNQWRGTQQYMLLWANGGHPGSLVDVTRRWTAPANGSIRITGSASDANGRTGDGVVVSISKGSTLLWQQTINNGDSTGFSYDLANTVVAGDTLNFTINRRDDDSVADNTSFDPTIVFTPAFTLAPVADAYVKGADAFMDANFGTATDLQVKRALNAGSGNGRQSYLRFDTSSVAGTISRATLRVYGNLNAMVGANQNIPCAVFPVSDAAWTENRRYMEQQACAERARRVDARHRHRCDPAVV